MSEQYPAEPYREFQEYVESAVPEGRNLQILHHTLARITVDDKYVMLLDRSNAWSTADKYMLPGSLTSVPLDQTGRLDEITNSNFKWHRRSFNDRARLHFCVPPDTSASALSWVRKLSYKDKDPKAAIRQSLAKVPGLVPQYELDDLAISRAGYAADLRKYPGDRKTPFRYRLILADIWEPEISADTMDNIVEKSARGTDVRLFSADELPQAQYTGQVSMYALSMLASGERFEFPDRFRQYGVDYETRQMIRGERLRDEEFSEEAA